MTDITQTELDEAKRESVTVNRLEMLRIVKKHFCDANNSLKTRCAYDQTVMGNFLTVLETDLKKDLKKLNQFEP